MSTVKISVIIPVFNNAQHLRECLDSVLQQSFSDFEVIIINDASSDNSADIIENYVKEDPRVNCIHQLKNLGVSAARNRGIERAVGKYVIFSDADDYWNSKDMLQILFQQIEFESADFISFGFKRVTEAGEYVSEKYQQSEILKTGKSKVWKIQYNIWAKMILKKYLDLYRIRFDETLAMGEDALFSVTLYSHANKVIITDKVFYCYRVNSRGTNKALWNSKKVFDTVRWFESAIAVINRSELSQRKENLLQSIMIERLVMFFNVLGPRAIAVLTYKEKIDYFKLWSQCLQQLESQKLQGHIKSESILRLYHEMLSCLTEENAPLLEGFFASERYLKRGAPGLLSLKLSPQQARQFANNILKIDKQQIRCDFGDGVIVNLAKGEAYQLARNLLAMKKKTITLNFK